MNEIATIAGSAASIAQDAAGNVTKAPQPGSGTWTFAYDAWDRPVALNPGGGQTVFAYDGQNRLAVATMPSQVRHFYYSAAWQVVEEQVPGYANPNRQFVWGVLGLDNLVLRDDNYQLAVARSPDFLTTVQETP